MLKRIVFVLVAALAGAATVSAQSSSGGSGQPSAQQPAGLWFVPTGEVLPSRTWSLSAYRVNFDRNQGFSDVSDWPLTFGVGAGDRAELFGAWSVVRRIDRDVRPLFVPSQAVAGG